MSWAGRFSRAGRFSCGRSLAWWLALVVLATTGRDVPGKDPEPASPSASQEVRSEDAPPASAGEDPVAATVDGYPIRASQVRRQLEQALRGRPVAGAAHDFLQAQALQQLVDRRLVLKYLSQNQLGASPAEVDLALAQVERQLGRAGRTLDEHLRENGQTRAELREQWAWSIGWRRYLDRYLTDENLRNWFERHRAEFDGRRVKVAHILVAADVSVAESVERARAEAQRIREEIVAGKWTFAEAAGRYSAAPSGKQGGEQGLIERHQPMPEAFSAAAFQLEPGGISPPVIGTHGVHLIQCLEIEAGKRQWTDARGELEEGVRRYLFEWTAARQRPQSRVDFTGRVPYFRPGSREVVAASASQEPSSGGPK